MQRVPSLALLLSVLVCACLLQIKAAAATTTAGSTHDIPADIQDFFPDHSPDFQAFVQDYATKNALIDPKAATDTCWKGNNAEIIHAQCLNLSYDTRSRMALALTNCHLEKSGRTSYPCGETQDTDTCLAALGEDSVAFNAYTQLFIHVDDICRHFSQEAFETSAKMVIENLYASNVDSTKTLKQLETASQDLITAHSEQTDQLKAHTEAANTAFDTFSSRNEEVFARQQSSLSSIEATTGATQSLLETQTNTINELISKQDTLLQTTIDIAVAAEQAKETITVVHTANRELQTELTEHNKQHSQALSNIAGISDDLLQSIRLETKLILEVAESVSKTVQASKETLLDIGSAQDTIASKQLDGLTYLEDTAEQLSVLQSGQSGMLHQQSALLKEQSAAREAQAALLTSVTEGREEVQATFDVQLLQLAESTGQIEQLLLAQGRLKEMQELLLEDVETTQRVVAQTDNLNSARFQETAEHLEAILQQSRDAEERIGAVVTNVQATVSQLLSFDFAIYESVLYMTSAVFYITVYVLVMFVTTAKQSKAARFALLLETSGCMLLEKMFAKTGGDVLDMSSSAFVRPFLFVLGSATLALYVRAYKDYEEQNNVLLESNNAMLKHIQLLLSALAASSDNSMSQQAKDAFHAAGTAVVAATAAGSTYVRAPAGGAVSEDEADEVVSSEEEEEESAASDSE